MRQRLMSRAPWNKLRTGGSLVPERWLSFSGQVAQSGPEYSIDDCVIEDSIQCTQQRIVLVKEITPFVSRQIACENHRVGSILAVSAVNHIKEQVRILTVKTQQSILSILRQDGLA